MPGGLGDMRAPLVVHVRAGGGSNTRGDVDAGGERCIDGRVIQERLQAVADGSDGGANGEGSSMAGGKPSTPLSGCLRLQPRHSCHRTPTPLCVSSAEAPRVSSRRQLLRGRAPSAGLSPRGRASPSADEPQKGGDRGVSMLH